MKAPPESTKASLSARLNSHVRKKMGKDSSQDRHVHRGIKNPNRHVRKEI